MAANKRDVSIIFRAKDKTQRAVKGIQRNLKSATESINNFAFSIKGFLTGAVAGSIGAWFVGTARDADNLRASLETATQSQEEAARIIKLLGANASELNSTVGDLGAAWIKLTNAGIDPSIDRLEAFLNVAAANPGKNLDQFVEAVADALRGEFERLKEFGISASKQGQNVEFTFRNVATTVRNTSEEIGRYLEDLGNIQFAGGVERQSQTIDGALSKLDNSLKSLGNTLNEGGGVGDNLREFVNEIAALVEFADKAAKGKSLEDLGKELEKLERGTAGFGEDNEGRKTRMQAVRAEINKILTEADGPDGLRQKLILLDEWMRRVEDQAATLRDQISERLLTPTINGNTEGTLRPLLALNEELARVNDRLEALKAEREGLLGALGNAELAFPKETEAAGKSTRELDAILKKRIAILRGYVDDSKGIQQEFDALAQSLENIGKAGESVDLRGASRQVAEIQGFLDAGDLDGAASAAERATGAVEQLIAARARFEELQNRAKSGEATEEEAQELENMRRDWVGSEAAIKLVIEQLRQYKQALQDSRTEAKLIDAEQEKSELEKVKGEVEKLNPKLRLNPDLSAVTDKLSTANLSMQVRLIPIVDVSGGGIVGFRASGADGSGGSADLEREADKGGYRL